MRISDWSSDVCSSDLRNVGRPFAIVLDDKVLSAPVIQEPITGGSGQISGGFTIEDTAMLSALLRAGALPAPLTVIEERSVGPDLGSDAIEMGLYTGLAGFAHRSEERRVGNECARKCR